MAEERFDLRARAGALRCPYCRDELSGKVQACPVCAVSLHLECWQELDLCPSAGCVGRPKRVAVARATRRAAPPPARGDLGYAKAWARFYVLSSAGAHALMGVGGAGALIWAPFALGQQGGCVAGLMLSVLGLFGLIAAGLWLPRVPAAWRAVAQVGETWDQQQATLRVEVEERRRGRKTYHAQLSMDQGGHFRFELGTVLSPRWLLRAWDEPVRLWSFSGERNAPFVIERLSDGALAPCCL